MFIKFEMSPTRTPKIRMFTCNMSQFMHTHRCIHIYTHTCMCTYTEAYFYRMYRRTKINYKLYILLIIFIAIRNISEPLGIISNIVFI